MGLLGIQKHVYKNSYKNLKMNYIEPDDLTCNMCAHFELTTDNEKGLLKLSIIACIIVDMFDHPTSF
jgi:hypothetical protein